MKLTPAQTNRAGWAACLPANWRLTQLTELADPRRSICYGVVQPGPAVHEGVLFVAAGDIVDGEVAPISRRIDARVAGQYRRSRLHGGELLVSLVGNPGAASIAPDKLAGANVARSVGVVPMPDATLAKWVAHYLNSGPGRALTLTPVIGSAQQVINLSDLSATPIPLPPPSLIGRVVRLLDAADATAKSLSRLIAAKRGCFHNLRRRLVAYCSGSNAPSGQAAARWDLALLGDCVRNVTRRNADDTVDLVLTCSGEHGLIDQRTFFSKTVASASREGYFLLHRGEFAYNRSAMSGYPYGAIKRLDAYDAGALSTLNICFALRGGTWLSDFAVHVFESGILNRQLGRIARVGSRAHGLLNVTKADFFALQVPVPPLDEQRRIADFLNGLDREIALLEQLRAAYAARKRGLMQRLLAGEVKLPADAPPPTLARA